MSILIENISKHFGHFQALSPLSLDINEGEMIGLLGPSGSGKTTLLRIIAGLEGADTGRIQFGDRDVTNLHVRDRRVGFVFQNYALFRHMTVADNVAFGLEVLPRKERPSPTEIKTRVMHLLEMVQLEHLANRFPSQLSGGQKQRIALARALATQPEVLLLDEPFGALDAKVRKELRRWLRGLHDELGFTSVFVTHDQEEALELSDRVVVMSNGHIEQIDQPGALYASPNSRFVFDFLGNANVFEGKVENGKWHNQQASIILPDGAEQKDGQLYIRSHEFFVSKEPTAHANLPLRVIAINPIGAEVRLELTPIDWQSNDVWEIDLPHKAFDKNCFEKGQTLYVTPKAGYFFAHDAQKPELLNWETEKAKTADKA
ncbi:sulfate/molybdate ABC transporter ATP-binding protein [Marinomonas sp. BSi20584]|uniref:sulfate/molybdate ABC transporter ATP-binding protein n=1 Tax=Marinomonas sp. BSi20584 TaxID=1594462 RepID=UPI000C1EE58A|nr:TOBE-like domain-containing protein [Marinomonas sp. BSi20584]PJE55952.1 sulfate ABC transporter ATP-binding protein [Marinomonas sp. BSi20584]